MGITRNQLHRRFSIVFLTLSLLAICLLCVAIALPFWFKAGWVATSDSSVNNSRYLLYQGLWSDFVCKEYENYDSCTVSWHADYISGEVEVLPKLQVVRGVELAALYVTVLSVVSLICLLLSLTHGGWRQIAAQVVFSFSSLLAGFLAVMGVLVVTAATTSPTLLYWTMALPTIAGFFLLFNGSMSFVVCRYDPTYGTLENPISPAVDS